MNSLLMLHHRLVSGMMDDFKTNYVKCEYIENPSDAYIDTGIKPNQDTRIKAKIHILSFVAWAGFFGCRGADAVPAYALYFYGSDVFYAHYGAGLYDNVVSNYPATGIHDIEFNKGVITIDTHTHNIKGGAYQLPVNMYLFGTNENGAKNKSNIRIYSCKVWDDGNLVRDYIPCMEKSTGDYGLYDKVSKQFFTSPNGVKFVGA